ncbi:Fic family protein (plasmid) [Komagataeibacter nataicola]|uniref:Fic family protein n=1 Tax=Komagataeibacter melomenusus TaxID=2766578 RepID=A0ABX2AIQ5_9PROT|nr:MULTISPECIES: Fic family protein [Komagataeibacter]MBV0890052.1 Fic family protein [Komagataeibacter oboediens]MBV1831947.1 Fic family protein [Komagataeibacter melomenusus]MCK9821681.1 Fic family protein [Komagataeibacter oboediens]NPC67655.1 Fic family protein [Komagataeibacter melomenusus]WEQ57468.1 Fic family protein [Komagataeibacter nataicola]
MLWNWQLPDWPHFHFEKSCLRDAETEFLKGSGVVVGAMQHLDKDANQHLVVQLMSQETVESSAIEGEVLDRASVQSSIARHLGFATDRRRSTPTEAGAAELMADLYRHYAAPLTDQSLFEWHAMLMNGRRDLDVIGGYRTHAEAMQIISGPIHAPHIHFEAPPSRSVPSEMAQFIGWFNRTAPSGIDPLPAIERAAIAHLWFETIHPFEDGNGRIGRAIAEKALAQTLAAPTLTALAATINTYKKAYYLELHRASQTNQIENWMVWFSQVVLEAQSRTLRNIRFLIEKTRFLDRLRGKLNIRQEKALLRMLAEGPDGFQGGLSAQNYRSITGATSATATRDLVDLVALGALIRTGENRYARYSLRL